MRRLALGAFTVVALSSATAGCAANNPSPVSAAAARALQPLVQELRVAASGKSTFAVEQKEQALVNKVQSLQNSGDLTAKRAQKIDDAAVRLLADFRHHNQPTPPPTSATPSITPTTESPSPTPSITPTTESPSPTPTITVTIPATHTAKPKNSISSSPFFPQSPTARPS
jgi:hypothetical protein